MRVRSIVTGFLVRKGSKMRKAAGKTPRQNSAHILKFVSWRLCLHLYQFHSQMFLNALIILCFDLNLLGERKAAASTLFAISGRCC